MIIARLGAAIPVALFLTLAFAREARSQDSSKPQSDPEILQQVEADLARFRAWPIFDQSNPCPRAWRQLTGILERNPNSDLRPRVEENLLFLEEKLGDHDLAIAQFYLSRATSTGHTKGAQDRLLNIVKNYPRFSRMDDVLFDLATASLSNDDREAARNYLLKVVCRYPYSNQVIPAFNRLNDIGFGVWKGCDGFKQ